MTATPRPRCSTNRPSRRGPVGDVSDDRLRLIFTCCHPALAPSAQIALTLRLLGGLETPYIARAFLVPGADDGQAARAGEAQDPRRQDPVPGARATPSCRAGCGRCSRSSTSIFNEGYTATEGDALVRADLCAEAIRLARILAEPDARRARGARAARAPAADRVATRGAHRAGRHHGAAPRPGPQPVGPRAHRRGPRARAALPAAQPARPVPDPGRDQRGAQRRARRAADTDWGQIVALYDQLLAISAEPGRRAQPRGRRRRARRARSRRSPLVDALDLDDYHLFHAARADLLARLGRYDDATRPTTARSSSASNNAERALLERKRRAGPATGS